MEDSERRKERLKAMRMVAAQAEASNYSVETNVMPGSLANPLLETPETVSAQEELCATPRFDFYTDPMAAFSAKKKRSATSKQVTEQSYFSLPSNGGSPMEQFSSPRPGWMLLELTLCSFVESYMLIFAFFLEFLAYNFSA